MKPNRTNESEFRDNPFDITRASDFSDQEIIDFWVDWQQSSLLDILKPRSKTPLLLLGGKGTGKTHMMRICSAAVQKLQYGGDLSASIEKEGYLGIYIRADGLNSGRFAGKGQSVAFWSSVFAYYFELWLSINLLQTLQQCFSLNALDPKIETSMVKSIYALFDGGISHESNTLSETIQHLVSIQKQIDYSINNATVTRDLSDIKILFSPGEFVFGIPEILRNQIPVFSNTVIIYLIDEIENFSESQQQFLNSLIRYRRGNVTIRIGARLYGVKTYKTLNSDEEIKNNSEFEKVELDELLRANAEQFRKMALDLMAKRILQSMRIAIEPVKLHDFFAESHTGKHYQDLTKKILENDDKKGRERPHFSKLKKHLESQPASRLGESTESIMAALRNHEFPLLEKLNIFLLYRAWSHSATLWESARRIAREAEAFITGGKEASPDYAQVLDHFKSDLLAQLIRDSGKRPIYAGLDTILNLSQGIPRNLLGLLKYIFRRSSFAGETPFRKGQISIESQTEGILDCSDWFWGDSQPDGYGSEVRVAIESLAELFRSIRYSDRPAECSLCSFSLNFDKATTSAKETIANARNWSFLIRIRDGAKNKNLKRVDQKFQINPMLAPKWGISESRRGTLEISGELCNAIFDHEQHGGFQQQLADRVASMLGPNFGSDKKGHQPQLFK